MAEENIKKLKYQNKCSVPGCKTVNDDGFALLSIPNNIRSNPEAWLKLFKLEHRSSFPSIFNICEKHFEDCDIVKSLEKWILHPNAEPINFLPDEHTQDFDLYDDAEEGSESSDVQSTDSLEKEILSIPIITMEEQTEEFHDAIENEEKEDNIEEKEENDPKEIPSGMEDIPEEEKVYHDLKPHITGEEEVLPTELEAPFTPKITDLGDESSKLNNTVPEEKVLKVIKRVAPARNPAQEEDEEESPTKRPRRNVIHKLIKPRGGQDTLESPLKKVAPKPVVIVKKVVKSTPLKEAKKVVKPVKISPKVEKITSKVTVAVKPVTTPKAIPAPPKIAPRPVATPKAISVSAKKVIIEKPSPSPEPNGAASRSRRNVIHKLIKPRIETPVKSTPVKPTTIVKVVSPIKQIGKPCKVEIYSSQKIEDKTPKKDDKSPKIIMVSSKLIQGSPKFVKSPQILKISPRNILAVKASPVKNPNSPIIVTPKKPVTVLPKVQVKRLTSKIIPIEEDSSRPRRNVIHKFIKTTNHGVEKVTPQIKVAPQKPLDPVESMHVELLKEFLSGSKTVQMEVVKRKATSIARIIGLKSFKASDDWTKKFIAGNLAIQNGGASAN
ncbi:hypothetical protein ACFFRR_003101 [Megaselia abdita]